MEIQKYQKQAAVAKLSQNVTVQALSVNNFAEASRNLPSRIELSFDVPKLNEMIAVTSEKTVCGFIEFELIKLAERINVSGNLTDGQIQSIAQHLVIKYPTETIADFKICFERASNGEYGKIFKLDGIEVGLWVKAYMQEKYEVMEEELKKEKIEYNNQQFKNIQETDWLELWKESIALPKDPDQPKTRSLNLTALANIRAMTQKEIEVKGKMVPAPDFHPHSSPNEVVAHTLHLEYIKQNYDARTGSKLANWIEESEWLRKLEE